MENIAGGKCFAPHLLPAWQDGENPLAPSELHTKIPKTEKDL